jgi:hypothetical protein
MDATYRTSAVMSPRIGQGWTACFRRRILLELFLGCTCHGPFSPEHKRRKGAAQRYGEGLSRCRVGARRKGTTAEKVGL